MQLYVTIPVYNYLTNRKQRVKIESSFSTWETVIRGLPQGSVLGPLLFNIFIKNLFMFLDGERNSVPLLLIGFKFNSMKMNPEKCHVMIIGNDNVPDHFTLNIDNIEKVAEDKLCLLGITIDRKLNFNSHIENLFREA